MLNSRLLENKRKCLSYIIYGPVSISNMLFIVDEMCLDFAQDVLNRNEIFIRNNWQFMLIITV